MATPPPTARFTTRVADYVRYRPGYPPQVMDALQRDFALAPGHVIADVGSGTGIFTALLLHAGCRVLAVEPNDAMRAAAEADFRDIPHFVSVAATAEHTTLPAASVDWVMAAQAFHWFDVDACRAEFRRILRPPHRVALLWNNRREDTPFLAAYEALLRAFALDYARVKHQNAEADGRVQGFFAAPPQLRTFPNVQRLDFEALAGRVRSSSYMPGPDHPRHPALLHALRGLFNQHAQDGTVEVLYETRLYAGTLGE